MRGVIRFADDAVLAFKDFLDAKRVLGVLGKRLAAQRRADAFAVGRRLQVG